MKVALVLLALLPVVFSAAIEERFIVDTFQHIHLHVPTLSKVKQVLHNVLGSGVTLAACDVGCPAAVTVAFPEFALAAVPFCPAACAALHAAG